MKTCGDLDGKPCEWFGKYGVCERHGFRSPRKMENWHMESACAPVLALVEARAEAARWKNLVLDGIKQAGERVSDDLREKVKRMLAGEVCLTCGGSGKTLVHTRSGLEAWEPCYECRGKGKVAP